MGPRNGADVLCNDVKKFRDFGYRDIHHPALKPGEVRLHVHRADHFLEGHSPHTPNEARVPKGLLVNGFRQGIESRRFQLGDVGGDGDTLEVCLLDRLVGVLEEQRDPAALAHCAAYE